MKKLSHGDLRGKSERELRSLANKLEKSVHQSRKDGKSTHSLETEICYIQRELELRRLGGGAPHKALGNPVQRETVGYSLSKTDGFGFQDIPSPPSPL